MDTSQSQSSSGEAGRSLLINMGDLLSTELWTLILEELSFVYPLSSDLRFVCRRFNDILTPFLYHRAVLSSSLVGDDRNPTCCQVKANIRAHARRIVIAEELDWDEVSQLIRESRFLQDLEWCYGKVQFRSLPIQIQNILRSEKPHIKLHINQQRIIGQPPQILQVDSIPPSNLSSIRLTEFWDDVRALQDLLAASTQLQALDLCRNVRFLTERQKIPPIKELTIHAWPYEREQVPEIWDLTKVERLKLIEVSMRKFLDSLPPQSFANVKRLEYDENTTWVDVLQRLVENIEHLEELDVICLAPRELIPALERHSDSLRVLKLRDLSGRRPQMDEASIREILRLCPNLVALALDLELSERTRDDEDPRLEILANFKFLRRLKIRSQRDVNDQMGSRQFAEILKKHILRRKSGAPLEELDIVLRPRPTRLRIGSAENIFTWDYSGKESFREVLTAVYR